MRQYQKYKPFQYDWLPVIPEHWDSKPLRKYFYISDERKGEQDTLELLSVYREYGVIPKASRNDNKNVESENTSKYKVVHTDDLVINKMKLWQGSLGISNFNGFVSPAYIVAHNEFDGNLRYLNFFLRSPLVKTYYNRISYGIRVGQWDSDFYDFKQLIVPIPPKDEQNQIVRYLDWKVSNINRLIHGYQRQIKLLEETKNTILDKAVFHGIENNNLVFSGNKLLEDIPEHWNIVKLRTLLTPISVKNHPNEQLLSVVREQGIIVRDIENKESNHNYIPDDLSGYKLVEKGNFVINKMKAWQGSYGVSNYRDIVSPAYRRHSQATTF